MVRSALIASVSLLAICQPIAAQERQTIQLTQGAQTVLTVNRPFSSVAVGDPDIADAMPRSDRVLVIVGKKVGVSDIIIFSDADQLYHATISVAPPNVTGKVYSHNKKNLSEYYAYQCNPVCGRVEDKFETNALPAIVLQGGGSTATGGSINVIVPPAK